MRSLRSLLFLICVLMTSSASAQNLNNWIWHFSDTPTATCANGKLATVSWFGSHDFLTLEPQNNHLRRGTMKLQQLVKFQRVIGIDADTGEVITQLDFTWETIAAAPTAIKWSGTLVGDVVQEPDGLNRFRMAFATERVNVNNQWEDGMTHLSGEVSFSCPPPTPPKK